jgi:hypothetical protein
MGLMASQKVANCFVAANDQFNEAYSGTPHFPPARPAKRSHLKGVCHQRDKMV